MAYTQADLDALKEALLNPAKDIQIGDRRMSFKDQKDLIETIRIVQAELEGTPSVSSTQIAASFSKGQK